MDSYHIYDNVLQYMRPTDDTMQMTRTLRGIELSKDIWIRIRSHEDTSNHVECTAQPASSPASGGLSIIRSRPTSRTHSRDASRTGFANGSPSGFVLAQQQQQTWDMEVEMRQQGGREEQL